MLVKTAFRSAYQQIYQRFWYFLMNSVVPPLSLKVLKMSILQKRQFISELPLCSPREYSKACVSMSYKVYQPIYQRKEKNVKKAFFFRFLGYFEVYWTLSGLYLYNFNIINSYPIRVLHQSYLLLYSHLLPNVFF